MLSQACVKPKFPPPPTFFFWSVKCWKFEMFFCVEELFMYLFIYLFMYLFIYLLFLSPICMAMLSKKFEFLVFYRVDDFILWSMWQVGIWGSTGPCFLIIVFRPMVSLQTFVTHSQICTFRFQFFYSWNISTQLTL